MLRDAAKRFLADNCSTKFVRQMMADESAHDAGFWRKLVGLGWPGLLIPEEYGGQGGHLLRRGAARRADRDRRRLRGAEKRTAAEDGQGRVYRDGRDSRGVGAFRC